MDSYIQVKRSLINIESNVFSSDEELFVSTQLTELSRERYTNDRRGKKCRVQQCWCCSLLCSIIPHPVYINVDLGWHSILNETTFGTSVRTNERNERINERNERINERNERTNEGTNERTKERTNERKERTNERMNEGTKERTNERTDGRTDGRSREGQRSLPFKDGQRKVKEQSRAQERD